MGASILVTGGAGYVGSHVVAELVAGGNRVVVFDNLQQGHAQAVVDGAQLIAGDLADRYAVRSLFAGNKFDSVMHFAANSLVGESMKFPFRYLRDNVSNAINLIEAAVEFDVKKFVFSSTCAIFGNPERVPIDEGVSIDPGNPYGESKYLIERVLRWAEEVYGMKYAALRYFNAAGAHPTIAIGEDHNPETHLIPIALRAAAKQRSHLEIFGDDYPTPDGTCIRDYIHVCDLADAHIRVLQALETRSCQYNVGTGHGYSVREVIDAVNRVAGVDIPVRTAPRRPGDPAVLVAASDKIKADLGWNPQFSNIDTIVETAWSWARSHPDGFLVAAAAE